MNPVEAIEVNVAGQDQAAVVTGHQAGRDGHLCPRGNRAISGELEFIHAYKPRHKNCVLEGDVARNPTATLEAGFCSVLQVEKWRPRQPKGLAQEAQS